MKVVRFDEDPIAYMGLDDAGKELGVGQTSIWKLLPGLKKVTGYEARREGRKWWIPQKAVELLRDKAAFREAAKIGRAQIRDRILSNADRISALEQELKSLKAELSSLRRSKTRRAKQKA